MPLLSTNHPLDRAVWSALTGRQSHLARGDAHALRFDPDFALFAAMADDSPAAVQSLGALVLPGPTPTLMLQPEAPPTPAGTFVKGSAAVVQMVATTMPAVNGSAPIEPLRAQDGSEMLALARLTEPGPFEKRTHELGDFFGIRDRGRLIAMAGERLKPDRHTEVSGVCTHPDHRGRGYAGLLMATVMRRIFERGETPFLHAYASNKTAIDMYERRLGYVLRREISVTMLARAESSSQM